MCLDLPQNLHRLTRHLNVDMTLGGCCPGTEHGDELEILTLLIDRHENEKFPIGVPDPIEVIFTSKKIEKEKIRPSSSTI